VKIIDYSFTSPVDVLKISFAGNVGAVFEFY
jgi:hypothetical protein